MSALLQRETFTTSRLMDFFSQKELTAQIGHGRDEWPLVVIKELIDNSLDACEDQDIVPVIEVIVSESDIMVADNGPGISPETVARLLNYSVRVSSREAYVSPTRGAQGNALKTLVAMPFVLDGERGSVTISARGTEHRMTCRVDRLRQEPVIEHQQIPAIVKTGTTVMVHWPDSASSILQSAGPGILQMVHAFAWTNPHATFRLDLFGESHQWPALDPAWRKWRANEPTSPHWYTVESLERLVAAYLANDAARGRTRPVRELVADFRGLSGSPKQKAVLEASGLARQPLTALVRDGALDRQAVTRLLAAMQAHSAPVKPEALGIIGKAHLSARMQAIGAKMESFRYASQKGVQNGSPWVVESAFAWCPELPHRMLVSGVNFSPGILNPFRELGGYGLDGLLEHLRAGADEPVIHVLYYTCARVAYSDRGKSAVMMDASRGKALSDVVTQVSREWTKQRKAEDREASRKLKRHEALTRTRRMSIKEAAYLAIETAYLKASANGTLPAHARQVMYAARGQIQEMTGKQLDDAYFTQTLLPDFIMAYPQMTSDWDVVFDARGHLTEPHTGRVVPLGTIDVRHYLAAASTGPDLDGAFIPKLNTRYPACGPANRYGAILFIEKEGFLPLFERVRLAERYDISIKSTKGMSVVAARLLVDRLCHEAGVPLLVLRDFDKAGFSIAGTLKRDTRRYTFGNSTQVIDLGLRLSDVRQWDLESEQVFYSSNPARNLIENGATDEEIRRFPIPIISQNLLL
jgi:DNA topoisomerase VI subunit B